MRESIIVLRYVVVFGVVSNFNTLGTVYMVYWRQWLEKRCPQGEGYAHMHRLRNQCFVHVSNSIRSWFGVFV